MASFSPLLFVILSKQKIPIMEAKGSDRRNDYKSLSSKDVSGDSSDDDAEVEREFKRLLNTPQEGEIKVSTDPQAKQIAEGFTINWMNVRMGNWRDVVISSLVSPPSNPLPLSPPLPLPPPRLHLCCVSHLAPSSPPHRR